MVNETPRENKSNNRPISLYHCSALPGRSQKRSSLFKTSITASGTPPKRGLLPDQTPVAKRPHVPGTLELDSKVAPLCLANKTATFESALDQKQTENAVFRLSYTAFVRNTVVLGCLEGLFQGCPGIVVSIPKNGFSGHLKIPIWNPELCQAVEAWGGKQSFHI